MIRLHWCMFDQECRYWGAPPRLYISLILTNSYTIYLGRWSREFGLDRGFYKTTRRDAR